MLAGILLIAITVTAASLASGWITSTVRGTTDTVTNRTDTSLLCDGASISIDNVFIVGTVNPANVTVVVRNNGLINGMIVQNIQLYNTTGTNFTSVDVPITNIDRGDVISVTNFNDANLTACPASFSRVLVTTNCGGIEDTFTAVPKCT